MTTKLNYTGRLSLAKSRADLAMTGSPDGPLLNIRGLDLSGLDLPADGRVVVEAQDQTNYMRFECGHVSDVIALGGARLSEFDSHEGITFRVKVIGDGASDLGKLLAVADHLNVPFHPESNEPSSGGSRNQSAAAEGPTRQESLLPFKPRELDQLAWLLDTSGDRPIVYVNRNLPNWRDLVASSDFRVLVLPAVLRQIAVWLIREQDVEDAAPGDAVWPWRRFLEQLGCPAPSREEPEKHEDWADEVVFSFTRRYRLFDAFLTSRGVEEVNL